MGNGTAIARHAAAGVEVLLLCMTRGGAGWGGLPVGRRPEELPEIRTTELERAGKRLRLASVSLCGNTTAAPLPGVEHPGPARSRK